MPPPRGEEQEVTGIQCHARCLVRHHVPKQGERRPGSLRFWSKDIYLGRIAHEGVGRIGCRVVGFVGAG